MKYPTKVIDGELHKQCSICLNFKKYPTEFPSNGGGRFKSHCKKCDYLKTKEWRKNNSDKLKQQGRRYNIKHKTEVADRSKKYYEENKEERVAYAHMWYLENRETVLAKQHEYSQRLEVKERRKEYWKKYYEENKEMILEAGREYYQKNKDERAEYRRKNRDKINTWFRNKYETDPKFRIRTSMSSGIRKAMKNGKSGWAWEELVGYTLADLCVHLESLFRPGMTWDNYGSVWEIDHVVPVSWFNYTSIEDSEFYECWKLSNLQPLFKHENRSKQDRYEG